MVYLFSRRDPLKKILQHIRNLLREEENSSHEEFSYPEKFSLS